jgi:D-3-phosphoglycerate dehydrogenase
VARPKVVVAEAIADAGIEALAARCEVDVAVGVDRAELLERMHDATALIVRSATQVDAEMIAAAPHLEVIGRAGIGVDNIDLPAATGAGVLVVNAPHANTISAAEHTIALMLALARRVPEADATLRAGSWERKRLKGVELHGKTLGVAGLGKIGTLVAQRASAFGMRILAYDPYVSEERARRLGVELGSLDDVFAEADFLTIHLPRTRETEGLIGADAFAKMKPTARVINVARGGIVDEAALAAAIRQGAIAGAAVDVFAKEPATESPLFGLAEVVVTPHLGASTQEAQDKAGISVAESVAAALSGELVLSAVNIDLGPQVSEDIKPFLPLAEALGKIYVAFSKGLPGELTVCAMGRLAEFPVRPLALGVLKGALLAVSDENVSYVNAPLLAESHGLAVREEAVAESADYQAVIRLRGEVGGVARSITGTFMERKGPVVVEIDGYEIELPITRHMLLIRNEDVPGVIGRVGTYLGDARINIADMAVGRHPDGGAMMGLSIDGPISDQQVDGLLALDGVAAARYIEPIPVTPTR